MHFINYNLIKLRNIIGDLKTIDLVVDYCSKNNKMCTSMQAKSLLCKHILEIYGYKFNTRFENISCKLFKEIKEYSSSGNEYIKINDTLLHHVIVNGSNDLVDFFTFNYNTIIPQEYFIQRSQLELEELPRIQQQNSSIQNSIFNTNTILSQG